MVDFEAGVFLIDKPEGPSSFTIVRHVRRILGIKKVGHAGTLDPFASGLLIVCAGRKATKLISRFMDGEKEYLATIRLGVETTTQDPEGDVTRETAVPELPDEVIKACLEKFKGSQKQVPPAFSALKHKGKPLYYYARKGIEVKKESRLVQINNIERTGEISSLSTNDPYLHIRVNCSKGTYIRTLAADIGNELGCGGHLVALRRTKSGLFSVENSFPGEKITQDNVKEQFLSGALSINDVCNLLH